MTKQIQRTSTNAKGSRRGRLSQATIQLISDGVVASYIHDISTRHRALLRVRPEHQRAA